MDGESRRGLEGASSVGKSGGAGQNLQVGWWQKEHSWGEARVRMKNRTGSTMKRNLSKKISKGSRTEKKDKNI